jgi:hypothetical protein
MLFWKAIHHLIIISIEFGELFLLRVSRIILVHGDEDGHVLRNPGLLASHDASQC